MDPVTFVSGSGRVPPEVKKLSQLVQKLPESAVLTIVALAKEYLLGSSGENGADGTLDAEIFPSLASQLKMDQQTLAGAFTGMLTVVRTAVRLRIKTADFAKDMELLKFPAFVTSAIQKILKEKVEGFVDQVVRTGIRYPGVAEVRWRVDVAISSNALSRILAPCILMELTDSEGNTKVFEMTVEKFHELRHSTAKLLRDMEDLEKLQILKIA